MLWLNSWFWYWDSLKGCGCACWEPPWSFGCPGCWDGLFCTARLFSWFAVFLYISHLPKSSISFSTNFSFLGGPKKEPIGRLPCEFGSFAYFIISNIEFFLNTGSLVPVCCALYCLWKDDEMNSSLVVCALLWKSRLHSSIFSYITWCLSSLWVNGFAVSVP